MADRKHLGNATSSTTTSIYSPGTNLKARRLLMFVAETSGTDRTWSIYHDVGGTTFAADNALYEDIAINANTTTIITLDVELQTADAIGVGGSTTDVTFTLWGEEVPA